MEILHFENTSKDVVFIDVYEGIQSLLSSTVLKSTDVFEGIFSLLSSIILKFVARAYDDTFPIYAIVLDFINMNGGIY